MGVGEGIIASSLSLPNFSTISAWVFSSATVAGRKALTSSNDCTWGGVSKALGSLANRSSGSSDVFLYSAL